MKNKKVYYSVLVVLLLIVVVSTTYAFFAPQQGGTTSTNATVTSNTTDLLTFSINRDISFTVTQALFAENGENQSGDATATATLTPNNKTGAATMNYYLYLNLQNNPTVYSAANTNNDPELMLQVFDGNNELVTIDYLDEMVTVKGVTGYDITGITGLKTLLDNHAISASNNTAAIENWKIVITLINLDVNQNDNTGKTIEAEIIISKEEVDLGFTGTIYRNNTRVAFNNHSIEDELTSGWCLDVNGTPDCTWPYPTQEYCEYVGEICSENEVIVGAGTYETNVNTIRESYSHYLKHEVQDNIIKSSEVCLWYNNHEFCMGNNYWDTDGETTKLKLKTDMEAALGIQVDCGNSNSYASCTIDYKTFSAYPNGGVEYSYNGGCSITGADSSVCAWW